MKICFATNNQHKIDEVQAMLPPEVELVSLKEIGCEEELPEEQDTLQGNARQKAMYVWDNYHVSCFADDTGLEIPALNNEPGVYSARYAGPQRNSEDNMQLVLDKLKNGLGRQARFRTVICLVLNGEVHEFEGAAEGKITHSRAGQGGFGYDPIFVPEGYDKTFAELSKEEKNSISHRGRATKKLVEFLREKAEN